MPGCGDLQLSNEKTDINELWVVIPVKPPGLSKQRLRDCLGPFRAGLTLAMLSDVLQALRKSSAVEGTVIVTMDAEVADLAAAEGTTVVREAGPYGMNRAIEQGCGAARSLGAAWLAVLPLDVPLLTSDEFDRLVRELSAHSAAADRPVVGIVPARDGGGTNWLCLEAGVPFTPAYGPGSYRRHLEAARAHGQQPITLHSANISLDLDEAGDLSAFLGFCRSHVEYQRTATWQYLRSLQHDDAGYGGVRFRKTDESNHALSKS